MFNIKPKQARKQIGKSAWRKGLAFILHSTPRTGPSNSAPQSSLPSPPPGLGAVPPSRQVFEGDDVERINPRRGAFHVGDDDYLRRQEDEVHVRHWIPVATGSHHRKRAKWVLLQALANPFHIHARSILADVQLVNRKRALDRFLRAPTLPPEGGVPVGFGTPPSGGSEESRPAPPAPLTHVFSGSGKAPAGGGKT